MEAERSYYLKVDLNEEQNNYLKKMTRKVVNLNGMSKRIEDNFHLTIKERMACNKEVVRYNLCEWLKNKEPFDLILNKINFFENRRNGTIYLTPGEEKDLNKINDLHYGICDIIKPTVLDKKYTPHITLLKEVPLDKLDEMQEIFSDEIIPFRIKISEILIEEKIGNEKNEYTQRFNLGLNFSSSV